MIFRLFKAVISMPCGFHIMLDSSVLRTLVTHTGTVTVTNNAFGALKGGHNQVYRHISPLHILFASLSFLEAFYEVCFFTSCNPEQSFCVVHLVWYTGS